MSIYKSIIKGRLTCHICKKNRNICTRTIIPNKKAIVVCWKCRNDAHDYAFFQIEKERFPKVNSIEEIKKLGIFGREPHSYEYHERKWLAMKLRGDMNE